MSKIMTLMFTDLECKEVVEKIEASGTNDPDLVALSDAMRPNDKKLKRGAFMAYVDEKDDEIFPGFKLSDHAIQVSIETEEGNE